MSHPIAARHDDTVPAEPSALVCPRCKQKWPTEEAPATCPTDGVALVRPRDLVDPGDDPMVGRTLEGRYTILARLGAGSMGTVYRAKQHAMGREVAIKILRGDRAVDDSAKARFMREARANSLLASPNTVTVFDFGQSESGEFYLAMELLEGESLGQRLQRVGRLAPAQAVDAARPALRSLAEAHAKGIIHRDLKPDNLFFARVLTGGSMRPPPPNAPPGAVVREAHDEIVKVLDFGIAKMLDADDPQPMGVIETQAGTVFGTPRYMSPEQAQGKPLDARSDLYSLGVIVYQMLTGRPPFTDNDAVVVMARHIKSVPKRPNEVCPEANVPRELEDVVMRALSKTPDERPATAEIFAGELLAALEAQGAMSSGVRASVTNAAGIRVPDSMRPPPMSLPKGKRRIPLVALVAAPFVALAVGVGVYAALASSGSRVKPEAPTAATTAAPTTTLTTATTATALPAAEPATATTAATATTETTATAETATASAAPSATEPPTFTPDALPKAAPSTTARPTARPVRPPRPRGTGSTPPPSGSPSSTYGIFEN